MLRQSCVKVTASKLPLKGERAGGSFSPAGLGRAGPNILKQWPMIRHTNSGCTLAQKKYADYHDEQEALADCEHVAETLALLHLVELVG